MEILSILERYEKENTQKKDGEIKVITLNYRDIYSIGFIPDRFRYIEELYLNHNAIEQLNGIQQFPFLKLLSVKFNMIQSVDQFLLVLNKKSLTCLNFIGNPVEKDPSCTREFFLRTFPNLEELNDKNVNATGLKYIDTAPLTSRQQHQQIQQPNAMTVMTATDSLRSNSSQERAAAVQNLRPIHEEENTNTIIKPINKPIPKTVNLQDSAIILTDHYRYENLPSFNHQKTATFAQSQAWGNQSKHYFTNEEPMQLEMTERFTSSQILPFIADQSRINEPTYLQEKSIEFGLQNTLRRSKTPPKGVKASFRQDNSCMESMNQDLSQMSNLFDKHIENIDKDIQDLARVFHEKSLKEKTMKGLMMGAGVDLEKNNKAIQFRNNIRLIRVFYAWVFYMNTTRRKEELIHAITDPRNKSQFQSAKKEGSLLQKKMSDKENSQWQTIKQFTEFSDNEKTKRHNYFMTEDFM